MYNQKVEKYWSQRDWMSGHKEYSLIYVMQYMREYIDSDSSSAVWYFKVIRLLLVVAYLLKFKHLNTTVGLNHWMIKWQNSARYEKCQLTNLLFV